MLQVELTPYQFSFFYAFVVFGFVAFVSYKAVPQIHVLIRAESALLINLVFEVFNYELLFVMSVFFTRGKNRLVVLTTKSIRISKTNF